MEPYMLHKSIGTPSVTALPVWPSWGSSGVWAVVLTLMSQLVGWGSYHCHFILIHVPGFWVLTLCLLCSASNCKSTLFHMSSWQIALQTTPSASFHPNSSIQTPSTMRMAKTGHEFTLQTFDFLKCFSSFSGG